MYELALRNYGKFLIQFAPGKIQVIVITFSFKIQKRKNHLIHIWSFFFHLKTHD